ANLRFSLDLSILMYTSTILGGLSGKDLRRRHARRRLAATRRWWTCRSIVCRRLLQSPRLLPSAKPPRGDAGWIGWLGVAWSATTRRRLKRSGPRACPDSSAF